MVIKSYSHEEEHFNNWVNFLNNAKMIFFITKLSFYVPKQKPTLGVRSNFFPVNWQEYFLIAKINDFSQASVEPP